MKTVLLFGGRSFLGGHVCRALVNKGYRVLLHSTSSSHFENLQDILPSALVTPVVCKYDDHKEIENLLNQCEFFIHSSIPYFMQSIGMSETANLEVEKFTFLLEHLLKSNCKKSVFVSVCGTIGHQASGLASEEDQLESIGGWGHLKFKMKYENLVMEFCKKGLQAVVINPTMLVGEQDCKPSSGELFIFLDSTVFNIMNDQKMNIVDVEDAANAAILALEKGKVGERYIISGNNIQTGDLTRAVKTLSNKRMPLITLPLSLMVALVKCLEYLNCILKRPKPLIPLMGIEIIKFGSQHYSCEKAKRELGYAPKDAWLAVSRGYHWYKEKSILK